MLPFPCRVLHIDPIGFGETRKKMWVVHGSHSSCTPDLESKIVFVLPEDFLECLVFIVVRVVVCFEKSVKFFQNI